MVDEREDFFLFKDEAITIIDRAMSKLDSLYSALADDVGSSSEQVRNSGVGQRERFDDIIYDIYSDIHTVKGESGFFGLFDVAESLHHVEDELLKLRKTGKLDKKVMEDMRNKLLFARTRIKACASYSLSSTDELAKQMKDFFSEYARVLGKKAELKMSINTEIQDKMLTDIMHIIVNLIRNSVEHGIEPSEERVAKGKPEVGEVRITIRELRENSDSFLEIEYIDDGRGFSPSILDKVSKEGFEAIKGFSSKKTPTIHSGRGMGLYSIYKIAMEYSGNMTIENRRDTEGARILIRMKKKNKNQK